MAGAKDFFSEEQRLVISKAIASAELNTSGEIRVHIEDHCKGDALERAFSVFQSLKMHRTKLNNGVLFYLAVKDRQFAIAGDKGIHAAVPNDFWNKIREHMMSKFKEEKFTEGLCEGIEWAGKALMQHFPRSSQDKNELGNEVSFGKENG